MDVSRKILKNVSKRTTNAAKSAYSFGERSVQGHVVEAVILVILIVFTAVVLKFLPTNFLCWFNHIVVKIIFLIVIAFVALYSPAVGLLLAILLVSLIQMCQKKQLSQEIDILKQVPAEAQQPVMPEPATTSDTVESMQGYMDPQMMGDDQQNAGAAEQMMEPQGFNEDSACLADCHGQNGGRQLDGMCGNVQTWNEQISAQGLNGPVVGLQKSVGYPV